MLRAWYRRDADGIRVQFPETMKETGIRTPDFVARPARPQLLSGRVHGRQLYQFDFTEAHRLRMSDAGIGARDRDRTGNPQQGLLSRRQNIDD